MSERVETWDAVYSLAFLEGTMKYDSLRVMSKEQQGHIDRLSLFISQNRPTDEDDRWVYIDNTGASVRGCLDIHDCKRVIEEQADVIRKLREEAKQ